MLINYQANNADFFDWYKSTNQLHKLNYSNLRRSAQNYLPIAISWDPQNKYFLYTDNEIGVCGSAILSPAVEPLQVADLILPPGTWILQQTLFHVEAGHPIYSDMDHFDRLIEDFYLKLFEHVWDLSKQFHLTQALTLHNDWSVHDDLKTFGGYIFELESRLMDMGHRGSCVGVLALNDQTYQRFQERKVDHEELMQIIKKPVSDVISFARSRSEPLKEFA